MEEPKPWVRGPFELIRHAEQHLNAGGDFDRRMALISYDNAVEIALTTYLTLHPRLRGGKQYPRDDVDRWMANYHSKLDFLEHHVQGGERTDLPVSIEEIIYCHSRRNELYHSGNGLVPEETLVHAARKAALWVFEVLFGVDAEEMLDRKASESPATSDAVVDTDGLTPQLRFLEAYISFEAQLNDLLREVTAVEPRHATLVEALDAVSVATGRLPEANWQVLNRSLHIRNALVHGQPASVPDDELAALAETLREVAELLRERRPETSRRPNQVHIAGYTLDVDHERRAVVIGCGAFEPKFQDLARHAQLRGELPDSWVEVGEVLLPDRARYADVASQHRAAYRHLQRALYRIASSHGLL